jgi:hypothetical protein
MGNAFRRPLAALLAMAIVLAGCVAPSSTPIPVPQVDAGHKLGAGPDLFNTGSKAWFATVSAYVGPSTATSPKRVFAAYASNANASVRYFQIFDSAAAPVAGQVPVVQFILPPSGGDRGFGEDMFTVSGIGFQFGVAWGVSTTRGSYTAATAADHDVTLVSTI